MYFLPSCSCLPVWISSPFKIQNWISFLKICYVMMNKLCITWRQSCNDVHLLRVKCMCISLFFMIMMWWLIAHVILFNSSVFFYTLLFFSHYHHDLTNYMTFWWSDDNDQDYNIMHMQCKFCVCEQGRLQLVASWIRVLCSFLSSSHSQLAFLTWLDLLIWCGVFCSFFAEDEPVCFLHVYYGDLMIIICIRGK